MRKLASTKAAKNLSRLAALAALTSALGCPGSGNAPCDVSSESALEALAAAADLQCDLLIEDTAFTTLNALTGVRSTPYNVTIRANATLVDADALTPVTATGFYVDGNDLLPSVTFDADGAVGDVVIAENPALASVSTPNLKKASLWVVRDSPTESVAAAALEEVGTLSIARTDVGSLGFPNLSRVSTLAISENGDLPAEAIDALLAQLNEAPTTIQRCGNLGDDACPDSDEGEPNP